MSPDDSSLNAQAGFTRTFSIASLLLLSFVFLDVHLRFPLPPPFVSSIFIILLALLQMSFWLDLLYFDAAGWRRRGFIGWLLVV